MREPLVRFMKKKQPRRAQQVFLIQKGQDYPIFKSLFHAQHSKPFPQIFRLSKMKSLEQIKSRVVKLVVVCPFILKLYSVDRTIIYPGIKVYLSTHLDVPLPLRCYATPALIILLPTRSRLSQIFNIIILSK